MKKILIPILALFINNVAYAATVNIDSFAYVEIVKTINGKEEITLEEAKSVVPGQVVFFKNIINNKENKPIKDVYVKNDIPENMIFNSSVVEESYLNNIEVTYSIDGVKYDLPNKLKVIDKKTNLERNARPEDYKSIKWAMKKEVSSNTSFFVGYKATLK